MQITLPDRLKNEIWEFCRENSITDVEGFAIRLLETGFNIEKYGETPFSRGEDKSEKKEESKDDNVEGQESDGRDEVIKKQENKITQLEEELVRLKHQIEDDTNNEEEGPRPATHGSNIYEDLNRKRHGKDGDRN